MIECGIRSTGITIGGGKSVFRASASTSIGREPLTASGACRWCPKWPCRPSSAATTTAGGCSREDGPPGRRLSSRRKLRFISVESPSDFLGWPVKAISRGKNSLTLKHLKMFDGHFRCLFVIKVPLAEAARQPVELLRQPERWGIPTPSAAGHQLLNLKWFLSYIRSRSTKKQVQKRPAEKGFRVRWRCASNQSFSESFRETKDLANAKRFWQQLLASLSPFLHTHTHIQHLFNWKKNPVP